MKSAVVQTIGPSVKLAEEEHQQECNALRQQVQIAEKRVANLQMEIEEAELREKKLLEENEQLRETNIVLEVELDYKVYLMESEEEQQQSCQTQLLGTGED